MTRGANIAVAILMWCGIAAYVVATAHYGREKRASVTVRALHIAVADTTGALTRKKIAGWLASDGIDPIGRPVDSVDVSAIERAIASRPEVRHVSAWTDLDGAVTVKVSPRVPMMRVVTSNGYRFWFTDDGYILPDRGDFTAYVPIVTGRIPFPFSPSASGSYTEMRKESYNDFLGRFTSLDTERRELSSRLSSTRSDIRSVRASGPKRWWGRSRKEGFATVKAARIAELEKQRAEIETAIVKIELLGRELREKEKKSYQSHRFLSKLANFVEFIGRDRFWGAQIVQIDVIGGGANGSGGSDTSENGGRSAGGAEWREPQLEIIPRVGDHTILLGELDGTERQRLENLRSFYSGALWHEGWNEYRYINIKYGNQIVCTK